MAEPLTLGLLPNHLLDPAFFKPLLLISTFPTRPTLARQSLGTKRISPEGNLSVASRPSFAITLATVPADLTNYAPLPDFNSILCIIVPKGIFVEVDLLNCGVPSLVRDNSGRSLPKLYKLLSEHTAFRM